MPRSSISGKLKSADRPAEFGSRPPKIIRSDEKPRPLTPSGWLAPDSFDTFEKLRQQVRLSGEGYLITDRAGVLSWMSPLASALLNTRNGYGIGRSILLYVAEIDRPRLLRLLKQSSDDPVELAPVIFLPRGRPPLSTSVFLQRGARGDKVHWLIRKIHWGDRVQSDTKAGDPMVRAMIADMSLTAEQLLERLAGRLHDELGHMLLFVKMKLASLPAFTEPEAALAYRESMDGLDRAVVMTQSLVSELTPPSMQTGLFEALRSLTEDFLGAHMEAHFENLGATQPADPQVNWLLYQSVRELAVNVLKHGGARTAVVTVANTFCDLVVSIADDGKGLKQLPLRETGALRVSGLALIRSRMSMLGGALKLDGRKNIKGTRIQLHLPLVLCGPRT